MYKGDRYLVQSWLRERVEPKTDETSMSGMYEDILYQAQQKIHGKKLRWCYQEEATYLSLSGVGGAVAPVDEVEVVGKVNWSPERSSNAHQLVVSNGTSRYLFDPGVSDLIHITAKRFSFDHVFLF
jgi:hypothetical protein